MSTIEFIAIGSGGLGLAIWIYLLLFHGRFWRADQRLEAEQVAPDDELSSLTVFAVVPARNEADVIDRAVKSLLTQSNPAISQVFLVDDRSTDGTADAAWRGAVAAEAEQPGAGDRLTILSGADRPAGWTGKMWAVHQGVEAALSIEQRPDFLLLTDADIEHDFGLLRALLKKAVGADGGTPRVLTSLMVKLHARSALERFLIPAFVFFFQMLFPFRRVNDSNDKMAGAAGGCMLVETKTFLASGGIEAIRGEIIDDCALGRSMKQQGPIWLGLTSSARSLRPYDGLGDVWKMVARTAYTQLNYSPILLLGTVLGLIATYMTAPTALLIGAVVGSSTALILGGLTFLAMSLAFRPTVRLYDQTSLWGLTLPVIATLYLGMTLDSARRHRRGRGGEWKGRTQGGLSGGA